MHIPVPVVLYTMCVTTLWKMISIGTGYSKQSHIENVFIFVDCKAVVEQ